MVQQVSKIIQKSIFVSSLVSTELKEFGNFYVFWISGPFGLWKYKIPKKYNILFENNSLLLKVRTHEKICRFYNLFFEHTSCKTKNNIILNTLNQLFIGSAIGFRKILRVRGVGYKFYIVEKNKLVIDVGFTHLLKKELPYEFITRFSRKSTVISIKSKNLLKLTCFLSFLRRLRKPDVYKGKGIRYIKDPVLLKEGKKKKTF